MDQQSTAPQLEITDTESATPTKIKARRRQPCPCGSGKTFKNCHEGDPAYEVSTDGSFDAPPPPKADTPGATKTHFPGKAAKTIASQKSFHSYHYRRGG